MYDGSLAFVLSVLVLCGVYTDCVSESPLCEVINDTSVSVNCSRRHLEETPTRWPDAVNDINPESRVVVSFFNNSLSEVGQLPPLPGSSVAISFKSNSISTIKYSAFAYIPNVVYLDFEKNVLTAEALRSEVFQGPFANGTHAALAVETLNFGYNRIHSLDRYLFQHTPNLTRLYLNNNPIEILDHVTVLALASAVGLQVLDLASTGISTLPLDAFKSLSKLQQLDLSGNQFLTVPESLSLVGGSLQYLTFNNNPILELNDDSFIGLVNLKELEVGENKWLEEVRRNAFSPLKNLTVLHLCHNKRLRYISHIAFRGLKDKWTLKEVYLDDNNLSELPTDLMPWSDVKVLGMTGNNWLCNCDLINIVTKHGVGNKLAPGEKPYCVAPMRWSGIPITNITLQDCHTFDSTYGEKQGKFKFTTFRPKHILWSIFGVAIVVVIGMAVGYVLKGVKHVYKKHIKTEPIRYIHIENPDTSFA